MNLGVIQKIVTDAVINVAPQASIEEIPEVGNQTKLFGDGGILDSMALVSVLVEIEQVFAESYEVYIIIGDDRALSQVRSPFRSVGVLIEYVAILVDEAQNADVLS